MESAAEEKSFMKLAEDRAAAEKSFGHILSGDARDKGTSFVHIGTFLVHIPRCNAAAAGCNCSFALLNCSEITALTETVLNGMSAVLPESKQHNITISSNEKNVLGIIAVFFGAFTGRNSVEANAPKPTFGIRIMTTGDAWLCFRGPGGIWSRTTDVCVKSAAVFRTLVAQQSAVILRLQGLLA